MDDKTHTAATQSGPAVAPKLEITRGQNLGESFKLKLKTTIGRERDNDVILLDLKASRHHAQITLEAGQWLLEDLGSANGTFLNDTVLTTPAPLQTGDRIGVGESEMVITIPTQKKPQPQAAVQPGASTAGPAGLTEHTEVSPRLRPEPSSRESLPPATDIPAGHGPVAVSRPAPPPRLAWIAGGLILLVCFAAVFAIYIIATRLDDTGPAAATLNETPSPAAATATQSAPIPPELILIYEDDFSDSFGGWDDAFDTYTRKVYGNNRYQIEVNTSNLVAWGLANRDVADFEIEVEARQEDGDEKSSYGLLFRFEDRENFYRFDISGDGFFLLSKFVEGQWATLVDWTESEFINKGDVGNVLKVSAFGPDIAVWVNGQQLASVTDNSLTHGNFGFFAGTFAEPYTWVSYDNLKLWAPPGQEITLIPTATRPSIVSQPSPSPIPSTTTLSAEPSSRVQAEGLTPTPTPEPEVAEEQASQESTQPTPTSSPPPSPQSSTPTPTPTPTPVPLPEYASRDQTLARGEQEVAGRIVLPIFDVERGVYDIYMADIADGDNLQLIQADASQPALTEDGTEIAYRSWQGDRRGLYARPLDGDDLNAWGFDLFFESARPQFSPVDKSLIYFSRTGGDTPATYRVIDGIGQVMRHQSFPIQGKSPKWLPNGQQFVYSSCLGSGCGIILSNIDGSSPVLLTNHPSDTNPEVSPDGATVVFMSERGGNWEIYRTDIDGGNLIALTSDSASDGLPTWSPDGSKIAFLSNRDGQWSLWTMDPDGTSKRRHFVLPGPVDGIVRHDIGNSFGWVEENIDWIP